MHNVHTARTGRKRLVAVTAATVGIALLAAGCSSSKKSSGSSATTTAPAAGATTSGGASTGKKVGVSGTPAFFINGTMLSGAQPLDEFKKVIDAELKAAN